MIYIFRQNNSGGYFIENEVVSKYIVIQATTEEKAIEILADITIGYSEYCPCCGERWSSFTDDEFKGIEEYNNWKNGSGDYNWHSMISDEDIRFYESNPNDLYKLKVSEDNQ